MNGPSDNWQRSWARELFFVLLEAETLFLETTRRTYCVQP